MRDLARDDPWRESLERSRARRRSSAPRDGSERRQGSTDQTRGGGGPDQTRGRSGPDQTRGRSGPDQTRGGGGPGQTRGGGGADQTGGNRARARAAYREARAAPDASRGISWVDVASSVQTWGERVAGEGSGRHRLGPRGIAALALLAAIVASSLARGGAQNSPAPARADVPPAPLASSTTGSSSTTPGSGGAGSGGRRSCPLAIATDGYVNPLADAVVKPERIDQGVDYAGSGTLVAIGSARLTHVATSGSGWPGAFIEYQLLGGADAGCYVFYAEGVIPADGLHAGETVSAGQPIAKIIPMYPTGIELGWGAGTSTKTYAKAAGKWNAADDQNDVASAAGKNFSALIAALGGPPGKVEG